MKTIPAVVAGCMLSQFSWAGPIFSPGNTPNGQAYVSACAGSQIFGGTVNPGTPIDNNSPADAPYINCAQAQGVTAAISPSPLVNSGGAPANPAVTFTASTSMEATAGSISFGASVTGAPLDIFAGAGGSGGFNDRFLWTGPTGMWMPQVFVNATLMSTATASGSGEAVLEVAALDNGFNYLQGTAYTDFLAHNAQTKFGDTGVGVDYEVAIWTADANDQDVIANSQLITFAIPVTQNQQVNFGFYASYMVSSGDSASTTDNTEIIDPFAGFADPGTVLTGDNTITPVGPSDIGSSASGFDYAQTHIPEPGAVVLTGVGLSLCLLGFGGKRTGAKALDTPCSGHGQLHGGGRPRCYQHLYGNCPRGAEWRQLHARVAELVFC